jgi:hypothetical protein
MTKTKMVPRSTRMETAKNSFAVQQRLWLAPIRIVGRFAGVNGAASSVRSA